MAQHNIAHWPEIVFERLREAVGVAWGLEARLKGATVGAGVVFGGRPVLGLVKGSRVTIGPGVVIRSGLRNNPMGCPHPAILRTLSPGAEIVLGAEVGLSAATICSGNSIHIGEGTLIGAGAMILDNDFHERTPSGRWVADCVKNARAISIGCNVFVGARAIILKGVRIGDGAIIGAGAVVTSDVPDGQLAAGNPARVSPAADRSSGAAT